MVKVPLPTSESPDMLWYRMTVQVLSFWERSAMLPLSWQSVRLTLFRPSRQRASEPVAVSCALEIVISAVTYTAGEPEPSEV